MKKFLAYFFLGMVVQSTFLWASQYDIKQMTPEIEKAFRGRQSRYEELRSQKSAGRMGETARGYIQAFERTPTLESLADAENADRRVIYNAIVHQNGLGPNGLPQVEAVFAGVQREKARPGEPIQLPSGEWTQK